MLLVDAFNVLKSREMDGFGSGRRVLAEQIAWFAGAVAARSRWQSQPALLCFDGAPSRDLVRLKGIARVDVLALRLGPVHLVFAGSGREADDLIELMLDRAGRPWDCVVVSSDRRLRRAATNAGAEWVGAPGLVSVIPSPRATPDDREGALSPDEVRGWMDEFARPRSGAAPGAAGGVSPDTAADAEDAEPPPYPLDPVIREAIKEWRGRLSPDDLDMDRWLD